MVSKSKLEIPNQKTIIESLNIKVIDLENEAILNVKALNNIKKKILPGWYEVSDFEVIESSEKIFDEWLQIPEIFKMKIEIIDDIIRYSIISHLKTYKNKPNDLITIKESNTPIATIKYGSERGGGGFSYEIIEDNNTYIVIVDLFETLTNMDTMEHFANYKYKIRLILKKSS